MIDLDCYGDRAQEVALMRFRVRAIVLCAIVSGGAVAAIVAASGLWERVS